MAIAVPVSLGVNTLGELIDYAKKRPGEINVAALSRGGIPHLTSEWIKLAAGLEWTTINYPGTPQGLSDVIGGRVQVIGQADQPLRDAIVDVGRQAATLQLLGLDDLLDEILVRAFAGYQLPVQARLVQRSGDQPTDHQQQFHIAGGELAPRDGVHVEHTDQTAGIGFHRHRHHRREI